EGARECDSLTLAAGKLRRIAVGEEVELHQFQQFMDAALDFGLGGPRSAREHAKSKRDIFKYRHVAEERVMLKNETDLAIANADVARVLAMEEHLAGVGCFEARDNSEQRRLARARQSQQRDQLAGLDMEADMIDRNEVAELLADVSKLDTHAATLGAISSACVFGITRRPR